MDTLPITRVSPAEWHAAFRGRIAVCTLRQRGRSLVERNAPKSSSWSVDITMPDMVAKVRGMAEGETINL
jgi:hypothetical protein